MSDDTRLFEIFLDVQRGLPRQGPGSDQSTLKALSICDHLPENPSILDIGCGPGMQTVALAKAVDGHITAVDLLQEYLDQLRESALAEGVSGRLNICMGDMNELPFDKDSFDLIWSEGAAYSMGVKNALNTWKPFLKTGGIIAFSELLWLWQDPPSEVQDFFQSEYASMKDVNSNLDIIQDSGYEMLGHFTLPDADWWDHYYTPLEAKLPLLREKYAGDDEALSVVNMSAREIDMRKRFSDSYGYEFFIARYV